MGDESALEVAGRSVEEAIEKGLAQLGLDRDQVQVEVLSKGSRGLLGLGAEEARVRIKPAVRPPLPKAEVPAKSPPRRHQLLTELGRLAEETVREILDRAGIKAKIKARDLDPAEGQGPSVAVDIEGEDLGILIGRKGETLRDLQFLVRLIVSRKAHQWVNVNVDVENYKARRERQLSSLAKRMAEKVSQSRQSLALEPMPANERRIIHLALKDHPQVTTRSVGEDDKRKVVILPKQQP